MDKQTRRTLPVSFHPSSDSSENEDADPMFGKYASTPPSRNITKTGQRKRAEHRMLHSSRSRYSRSRTPEIELSDKESGKLRPTSLKWQQREVSKQRELERAMKQNSSEPSGTTPREGSLVSETPLADGESSISLSPTILSSPGIKVYQLFLLAYSILF